MTARVLKHYMLHFKGVVEFQSNSIICTFPVLNQKLVEVSKQGIRAGWV